MPIKEKAVNSTNRGVTSEAENDSTLKKGLLWINTTSGVFQNLTGLVPQNSQLKNQPKLSESVEDPELVLRTSVDVKTNVDDFKAECISARLRDELGANISKLEPSRKRSFEDLSDPGDKVLNPKKSITGNLSFENSSQSVPVKADCIFALTDDERFTSIRNNDGTFSRLSKVFSAVPSWLKEQLSPGKVSNGKSEYITSFKHRIEDQDAFQTPPSTTMLPGDHGEHSKTEVENKYTLTSNSSSLFVKSDLQKSQRSTSAVPLSLSLQSTNRSKHKSSFKTLNLNQKRRLYQSESAESSANSSRSPSGLTKDSDPGTNWNLGTKRARLSSSSYASHRKALEAASTYLPLSRSEMFRSPLCPGNTTYGGVSASRLEKTRPFKRQAISVKNRVKPADKPRPMTAMTRQIYKALESLAPPTDLDTPEKPTSISDLSSTEEDFKLFDLKFGNGAPTGAVLEKSKDSSDFKCNEAGSSNDGRIKTSVSAEFKFDKCTSFEHPKLVPGLSAATKKSGVATNEEITVKWWCEDCLAVHGTSMEFCPPCWIKEPITSVSAAPKKSGVETNEEITVEWWCEDCLAAHSTSMEFCPPCWIKEPIPGVLAAPKKSGVGTNEEIIVEWGCKDCLAAHTSMEFCPLCWIKEPIA
ncbi:hypothetical protein QYM36_003880 [Artemia franciscana]|uniref:Uncharacterized protein n=1 Tax=Artemia franciscana TaxID=6661 RepID=A0AA88IIU0_ARTSF|nr:hypothetical protein QYM36_003880 [Artemia franciscana]